MRDILDRLDDVHFAELTSRDVVRHRLVGAIVDAYGAGTHRDGRSADGRPRGRT